MSTASAIKESTTLATLEKTLGAVVCIDSCSS